ncbi:protein NPGR1 isoform X1 [Nymphaea colorata]|nr:protein NPGR1 isoform X1 [Nymphaea colorata]XP_049932830.1 protein NPGR1 isoform X1 [Nymphaea colorata]XP_049932831.1 protein NPGR1 isoform X1 [Nymphaea colorata]XP_049932832.1 protein NPGR1 isoform X1 [Nymphaea colorata]XP_049932833.1 protein NPGR1 isoform X1 [Nymphaea colorata]
MLCACSGEQFKFEEVDPPLSPESLATRDFSAGGISSRTLDCDARFEENHVEEVETTLKEALSLNYEEARALLGRLEYQRGNYAAALQVFRGIDIQSLIPKMTKSIADRVQRQKARFKSQKVQRNTMSMHSVSLLLEAILLKARSLEQLGLTKEAAKECNAILDIVEDALPKGLPVGVFGDCKLQEMFHKALELLPVLWKKAGCLEEAIASYRRALVKPWNLDVKSLCAIQKDLAATLLYCGIETPLPPHFQILSALSPKSNIEEAILLLLILMEKLIFREIIWDPDIMNHLAFALSISDCCDVLANIVEKLLPGVYHRAERWYLLSLCYYSDGQNDVALNLLKNGLGRSKKCYHLPSVLLAAKLCTQSPKSFKEGINFAYTAMELADSHGDVHLMGVAMHLLGVSYGLHARCSVSDKERLFLQNDSVKWLRKAAMIEKENPEVAFSLGLAAAVSRDLNAALESLRDYLHMTTGSSVKGWRLLALVVSAGQSLSEAETVINLALDETVELDHIGLLRLKCKLQIVQGRPTQAIETYTFLFALIQAQKRSQTMKSVSEVMLCKRLEAEAWQDLSYIYTGLRLWSDASICVNKAMSFGAYSPTNWHAAGSLFEARQQYVEALISFFVALTIEPDHVPSLVSAAVVLRELGKKCLPLARSFLMHALRLDPTNHEAWMNLGYISKIEGSLAHAADCFQAAFDLEQTSPIQDFA